MPRKPPPRLVDGGESNLRERIAYERESRGWSLAVLAERLTDAGCPMDRATAYQVERGNRRITWDESVALARVFGVTLDDLTEPMATLDDRDGKALLSKLDALTADLRAAVDRLGEVSAEYARSRPAVHEYVHGHIGREARWQTEHGSYAAPVIDLGDDDEDVTEAVSDLVSAVAARANREQG